MTTTPQSDALHAALAARQVPQLYPEGAEHSTPVLAALADRLERTRADLLLGGQSVEHRSQVALSATADLARASALARAAATYGYPRPALEQLGAQAAHLPAARSTDPLTARDSGERTRSTPNARNHLGRLLVGFLMYEHQEIQLAREEQLDADVEALDVTLTSEELAHRVGLGGSEFAKRCSDLLALGYIRVAQDSNGHDRTRRGDSGRQRLVFELTIDGRRLAHVIRFA